MLSRLAAFAAIGLVSLLGSTVLAQDVNNGKVLYNTPLVAGEAAAAMVPVTAPTRWTGKTEFNWVRTPAISPTPSTIWWCRWPSCAVTSPHRS
ncbi:MAG TPA: hypothetical protein PLJ16_15915 [Casimicrobium huifangae]|nr:hypothetical protein [Casimicrobium huifangae]